MGRRRDRPVQRRAEHMDLSRDEGNRYLGVQDISEWPGTRSARHLARILSVLDSNNPLRRQRSEHAMDCRRARAPEGRDEEVSLGSGGRPPRPAVDSPPRAEKIIARRRGRGRRKDAI